MYHKARLSETKVSFIIRINNLMLSSIYRCALYIGKPRHSHINKGIKRNLNKYILKPIKNVLISLQQLKVKRPMILVNKIRKNLTKSAIIQ